MRSATTRGFTLIELLVVIAIIGILSAIVLASLSTARDRGREASIQSTLKSMSDQIELMRADNANYQFVLNCDTPTNPLHTFVDSMVAQGATVKCISFPIAGDNYTRWGVSAEIGGATDLTAWSASPEGVVKWDTADIISSSIRWDVGVADCAAANKHLPTAEELGSLWLITSPGSMPNFTGAWRWSSTEDPSASANAYLVNVSTGSPLSRSKTTYTEPVRCVS